MPRSHKRCDGGGIGFGTYGPGMARCFIVCTFVTIICSVLKDTRCDEDAHCRCEKYHAGSHPGCACAESM